MRKLCLIALLLVPGLSFAQQQPDYSKVEIKVAKVSGNVYLLQGSGGNIAASVGDDGVLIVDTEYSPLADKIRAAIKNIGITDKPVSFVIDTHYHADHTNGNLAFGTGGATIIAQENLRKHLEEGATGGNGGSQKFEMLPQPKAALPVITFEDHITVHFNDEDIRVTHVPAAHTDGDSFVYFTKSNVLHTGDVFIRYGFPIIDVNSGGTPQGIIAACEKAAAEYPPDVKVIPGHGALGTMDDVRAYADMLKGTLAAVQKAIADHKTLDQMKQEKILAPRQKGGNAASGDVFTETLYDSLMGIKAPQTKHE
jgi:cyclase